MMPKFLTVLVLTFGLAGGAVADTVDEFVALAKAFAAEGKTAESAAAMHDAAAELWLQTPFAFARSTFVTDDAPRYGAYDPRPDNTFPAGEVLLVYAEPVGFGWRKESDLYFIDQVVDAALLSTDGDVLWEQKEFGRFDFSSRRRFMDYFLNLSLNITGLPKGEFVLRYIVTDQVRDQQATISLPFVHE
jgi:hypothetical protein